VLASTAATATEQSGAAVDGEANADIARRGHGGAGEKREAPDAAPMEQPPKQ